MSDEIMRETEERNEEQEERKDLFPCIPLRGVSIFPNTVVHFDIGKREINPRIGKKLWRRIN